MMANETTRRTVLTTLGATAVAVASSSAAAADIAIRGTVTYAKGVALPEGVLKVRLEDKRVEAKSARRLAETEIRTKGRKAISFELTFAGEWLSAADLMINVRLERADGWLLARDDIPYRPGQVIDLTLYPVMY